MLSILLSIILLLIPCSGFGASLFVVGDSLTYYEDGYFSYLQSAPPSAYTTILPTYDVEHYGGVTIADWLEEPAGADCEADVGYSCITADTPDAVLIQAHVNEIFELYTGGKRTNIADIVSDLETLITDLQTDLPGVKVYFITNFPMGTSRFGSFGNGFAMSATQLASIGVGNSNYEVLVSSAIPACLAMGVVVFDNFNFVKDNYNTDDLLSKFNNDPLDQIHLLINGDVYSNRLIRQWFDRGYPRGFGFAAVGNIAFHGNVVLR